MRILSLWLPLLDLQTNKSFHLCRISLTYYKKEPSQYQDLDTNV
nr:MAG TPA: hypothetical protein [Bacteriophage sp.]